MNNSPFDVAVIGAGAGGTLFAAQFRRSIPYGKLLIVGNESRPARGIAYGTTFHSNLLNVPAGKMSAFPHDMEHFTRWLSYRLPNSTEASFVKRGLYGDYLSEIFNSIISDLRNTNYIVETVENLSHKDGLWTLSLSDGSSFQAYRVVLALGNLLPPDDPIDFSKVISDYRRNPWDPGAITDIDAEAPVLLIGTGLTMIDVVLSLRESGHRGTIHAISRHGRLYQSHKHHEKLPLVNLPEDFKSPVGSLRWIRNRIKTSKATGLDWRSVIDSLRPHTAKIWQSWTTAQRKSFLRHVRNLWDIHRHRSAPKISNQLGILIEDRILQIHRGYLISAKLNGPKINIQWQEGNTNELHDLHVTRIINCTGPSRDYSKVQCSLIANLRAKGIIVPDELRLGFETDEDGRFINIHGESVQGLFTLGTTRIPALWESIAIPEIRNQALALAQLIVKETVEVNVFV